MPVEKQVQVGIARPTVPVDFGTSDLYSNWRPGRGESTGAIVAVPLALTQAKQLGGLTLDDEQLVVLAQSYSLRSTMERTEMEDDVVDSVDAIVVDPSRYEERIATLLDKRPSGAKASVHDLTETFDTTSPSFARRRPMPAKGKGLSQSLTSLTADREVSVRSSFLESQVDLRQQRFAASVDRKYNFYQTR